MKEKIIFIGCGAVTSEVIACLDDIAKQNPDQTYEVYGYLDDDPTAFHMNSKKYGLKGEFLGSIIQHDFSTEFSYVFGFANPVSKHKILNNIDIGMLNFPNIIHPSVIIGKTAKMGIGNVIYPHSVVGPNCEIGNFNLLTSYSFISHDCQIGDYNFFSTAGLSGDVIVKDQNFFGIRSTVIP